MTAPDSEADERLRLAANALGRAGLVHAYGHCSMRLDADRLLVCAPRPMGLIGDEKGTVVPITGELPPGVLGEVRAHQAIYSARPDINAVCRVMPPALMALSTQLIVPAARHGIGAYFHPGPKLWANPRLIRDNDSAAALAAELGTANAIVMRGNGAITVADTIQKAVVLAWFLEDAARVESDIRRMGFDAGSGLLDADEVAARQVWSGGVVERMWDYLTAA